MIVKENPDRKNKNKKTKKNHRIGSLTSGILYLPLFQWRSVPGTWLPTCDLYLCNKDITSSDSEQFYTCFYQSKNMFFSSLVILVFGNLLTSKWHTISLENSQRGMFAFNIQVVQCEKTLKSSQNTFSGN